VPVPAALPLQIHARRDLLKVVEVCRLLLSDNPAPACHPRIDTKIGSIGFRAVPRAFEDELTVAVPTIPVTVERLGKPFADTRPIVVLAKVPVVMLKFGRSISLVDKPCTDRAEKWCGLWIGVTRATAVIQCERLRGRKRQGRS
jgi:hypothetical protein